MSMAGAVHARDPASRRSGGRVGGDKPHGFVRRGAGRVAAGWGWASAAFDRRSPLDRVAACGWVFPALVSKS